MPPTATSDDDSSQRIIMDALWNECLNAPTREEYIDQLQKLIQGVRFETEESKETAISKFLVEIPVLQGDAELMASTRKLCRNCGLFATISGCTAWLKQAEFSKTENQGQNRSTLDTCLLLIEQCLQLLKAGDDDNDSADSSTMNDIIWQRDSLQLQDFFENQLFHLPQYISNACFSLDRVLPSWATPEIFFSDLVAQSVENLRIRTFSTVLIHLLLRKRKTDHIAIGIRTALDSDNAHKDDIGELLLEGTAVSTAIEKAKLIHSMVQHCHAYWQPHFAKTCAQIIQSSYSTSNEYLSLLIYSSKASLRHRGDQMMLRCQLSPLVDLPEAGNGNIDVDDDDSSVEDDDQEEAMPLFRRHLGVMVDAWTTSNLEDKRERHLTQLILCGLQMLPPPARPEKESGSRLIMTLFQGVPRRLEAPDQHTRSQGIKVAKVLAQRLGQTLDIEDPLLEEDLTDHDVGPTSVDDTRGSTSQKPPTKKPSKILLDPDADYISSEEEVEEGFVESELQDENVSIEDDDEEDLLGCYIYLKDILDVLRGTGKITDEPVDVENAMNRLPQLIQARPDDLYDISVSLALELVRIENKFSVPKFEDLRKESLVSILVEEPVAVGQALIECMFQGSASSFENRLLILESMQEAASQLSRVDRFSELGSTNGANGRIQNNAGKSRRKNTRGQQRVKYFRNDFTSVAPLWFYPIVQAFKNHGNDLTIWTGTSGSIFLSGILLTLANFTENAGTESSLLAKDLFLLSWSFIDAGEASIRSSVLVAISSCLTSLSAETAENLLTNANVQLQIQSMSTNETDTTCRHLANCLKKVLQN